MISRYIIKVCGIMDENNFNLHLYGKEEPRTGRKMGHLTYLSQEPINEDKIETLHKIKKNL